MRSTIDKFHLISITCVFFPGEKNSKLPTMKIYFLFVSLAVAVNNNRPYRLVVANRAANGRSVSVSPAMTASKDRSVVGMCSAAQDALGVLRDAVSAGISTLSQCAQFGKDKVGAEGVYVSFSSNSETCMWFKDCHCLASSSTCLGGDEWRSVAIADVIRAPPVAAIRTTSPPNAHSAIIRDPTTPKPTRQEAESSEETLDCDTTTSNSLMQSFQSRCQMTQSIWTTRLVAGSTLAVVVLLVAGMFGLAFYFDKQELANLGK